MIENKFADDFEVTLPNSIEKIVVLTFGYGEKSEDVIMPKDLFESVIKLYPHIANAKQKSKINLRVVGK